MPPFSKPSHPTPVFRCHPQDGHKGRLYCEEMEKDTVATSFHAYISSVDHPLFVCVCVCMLWRKEMGGASEALVQYPKYLLRHPWYVV